MANKSFYYMEVSVPNSDNIIGTLRELQQMHIAATNSKLSKIAREQVFTEVHIHDKVGDTTAMTIEFMNDRACETYKTAIADFRAWATENHGVEYVYEKSSTTEYAAAQIIVDKVADDVIEATYYDKMHTYMMVTLPTARGFIS